MKKAVKLLSFIFLIIILCSCGVPENITSVLSGNGINQEEGANVTRAYLYLDVFINSIEEFDGHELSICVDGEKAILLDNSPYLTRLIKIETGEHEISFYLDGEMDSLSTETILLNDDMTVECSVSLSNGILNVSKIICIDNIKDSEIEYEDLVGLSIDEATKKLSNLHFVNYSLVSDDSSEILNSEDWIVESQNLVPGEEYDKTELVELTCHKVYYQLYFDLEFEGNLFLAKYNIDIYLDDKNVGTIYHGDVFSKLIRIKEGNHALVFYKENDKDVSITKDFEINGDTTIACTLHSNDTSIELKGYTKSDGIVGANIEVPNLLGLSLSDAKQLLGGLGFSSIEYSISGSSDNWIVTGQNIEAGNTADKNDTIRLECISWADYLTDNYLLKSIYEAELFALEQSDTISFVDYLTNESMTAIVNEMSDTDKKTWIIKNAYMENGTAYLRLVYLGEVEMPDLEGETVTNALKKLEDLKFSAVTVETEDGSTYYDKDEYIIIKQSVDAGEVYNANRVVTLTARKNEPVTSSSTSTTSSSSSSYTSSSSTTSSSHTGSSSTTSSSHTGSSSTTSSSHTSSSSTSKYDCACVLEGTNYDLYYMVDEEGGTFVYFGNDAPYYGTVTGTLNTGYTLNYGGEFTEKLEFIGWTVKLTDAYGYQYTLKRLTVSEGESAFKRLCN